MFFSWLNKYLAIYKLSLKQAFSYRFEFGIWAILHPVRLVILYFLWSSIFNYSGAAALGGMTLSELIAYYVTAVVLDTYVGVDRRLPEEIYKGDMVIAFIRPVTVFGRLLAHELANRSIAFLFHMLPTAVFAFFFLGYNIVSVPYTALAMAAAFLGLLINYELTFIIATTTFWTRAYYGTSTLKEGLLYLMSGWLIPLTFFPLIIQNILKFTPYPYIMFFPNTIFLGKYAVSQALGIIAIQIFWIIALYGVYLTVWHLAKTKFTGEGV